MPGELGYATGPYVQAAALCENVIESKDGVLSLIRVVDRITVGATGPQVPTRLPKGIVQFNIVIMLKAGEARGTFGVEITMEKPSTERLSLGALSVTLAGGNTGANIVSPTQLEVDQEGLHWFDVTVDGRLVTRIPLQVDYSWVRQGGLGQ